MKYKIFCDESNHLLNTKSNLMVNGAILVKEDEVEQINRDIKFLKHKYNYFNELKWTKLLNSKKEFYMELIDYFFEHEMKFKATFIPNKKDNVHEIYRKSHDEFYYIVYFYTMRNFMNPSDEYKIYLDYKDINGGKRIKELEKTLGQHTKKCDIYIIQSQESQILQLCDIFIGAIGYKNRIDIEKKSEIKLFIIDYIEKKLGYPLVATAPWINKFNIFRWYLG
ncbi:MAG: Putative phage protein [uncultured Sulfurovum sp.]|uniref:Phage protein n=1 Tax=uncultured Sulfurovum sp. TaxID=269237 RepID=A0A6S6UBR9_9BACT|nr:MAG: Putative phage protein [uncultured Sulfurovum sp.]